MDHFYILKAQHCEMFLSLKGGDETLFSCEEDAAEFRTAKEAADISKIFNNLLVIEVIEDEHGNRMIQDVT